MAHHFATLTLDLIDEGRLAGQLEEKIREAQVAIIDHLDRYGGKAEKAKAKVGLEVQMVCVDPEERTFAVIGQVKISLPKPPQSATLARADRDDDLPVLLVRKSGSTHDNPRQGVLATKDGRTVNSDTGQVVTEG